MNAARRTLGRAGFSVSPLCFGTIPLGRRFGMRPADAASLLRRAYELGVNFVDTAEIYGNYEAIRLSLAGWSEKVYLATKSYAHDAAGMRASLERARRDLDRDRIDLFLLHEIEGEASLRGHGAALDFLLGARAKGMVGAVGISTHRVEGVRAACGRAHEIDVVHPLINLDGYGIADGGAREMAEAIAVAADLGLGVYAMKALAGGHLGVEAARAIDYVRNLPGVCSVAIGLRSEEELLVDLAYCLGTEPPAAALARVAACKRRLLVEPWCRGCGRCVPSCPFGALSVEDGLARVRERDCLVCGYCAGACADLCLKVV
ncbi:MAG: aldo/keto reductase [Patescibacteria group bacterium]